MKEMQETQVQSLGWEDPLEEGMANPLQYSCPENPVDRRTWRATVHRVIKSWTRLKELSTHAHMYSGKSMDFGVRHVFPFTGCETLGESFKHTQPVSSSVKWEL